MLTGVWPEVWNPYPYLRIFLPQKTADLKLFFEIFANRDPFLRVFLPQNGWFYHFFAIFAKWDPLLRIFLTKMGPMSKDFCWKSNPFGRHIPVCLNMWVPPPRIATSKTGDICTENRRNNNIFAIYTKKNLLLGLKFLRFSVHITPVFPTHQTPLYWLQHLRLGMGRGNSIFRQGFGITISCHNYQKINK